MNTDQLRQIVKTLLSNHAVVTSANKLHAVIPSVTSYIILNTDSNNLPGQHWIAIFCNGKECIVFDSYGQIPSQYIQAWIRKYKLKVYYNTRRVQSYLTTTCGNYCLYFLFFVRFIDRLHQGVDILFPKQLTINDYEMIVKQYSKSINIWKEVTLDKFLSWRSESI